MLLADQDRSRWDAAQIARGRQALERALALGGRGPYVIQAAIASLQREEDVGILLREYGQIIPRRMASAPGQMPPIGSRASRQPASRRRSGDSSRQAARSPWRVRAGWDGKACRPLSTDRAARCAEHQGAACEGQGVRTRLEAAFPDR